MFLFIGLLLYPGFTCRNQPVVSVWSKEDGIPKIKRFMRRKKFLQLMKFLRLDDKNKLLNRTD